MGAVAAMAAILLPWLVARVEIGSTEGRILGHPTAALDASVQVGTIDGLGLDLAWGAAGVGALTAIGAVAASIRGSPRRRTGLLIALGGLALMAGGALALLAPDALVERRVDAATHEISEGRSQDLAAATGTIGASLGLQDLIVDPSGRPHVGPVVAAGGGLLTLGGGAIIAIADRRGRAKDQVR